MSIAVTATEPSHQEPASQRSNQVFERLAEPFRRELKLHSCSTNKSRPPGRRTRRTSASAAEDCGIVHKVQVVTTVSTL